MIKPSSMALMASGLLIAISLYLLFIEIYVKKTILTDIRLINLLLFLSTSIAIHGILHFMAEVQHNYNPLETGKLFY